jgi:hypothetical protein
MLNGSEQIAGGATQNAKDNAPSKIEPTREKWRAIIEDMATNPIHTLDGLFGAKVRRVRLRVRIGECCTQIPRRAVRSARVPAISR